MFGLLVVVPQVEVAQSFLQCVVVVRILVTFYLRLKDLADYILFAGEGLVPDVLELIDGEAFVLDVIAVEDVDDGLVFLEQGMDDGKQGNQVT